MPKIRAVRGENLIKEESQDDDDDDSWVEDVEKVLLDKGIFTEGDNGPFLRSIKQLILEEAHLHEEHKKALA